MPHAEDTNNTMGDSLVNGDKPSSQFLSVSASNHLTKLTQETDHPHQHLTSYPVVSDSIETFKSNPYGAKSLDIADATYARFGKPVMPYLQTPISYAAPYVQKADELADKGLGQVDNHFPIVKEDTQTLKDTAVHYAFFPLHVAGQGKDYLLGTWQDEYKKTAHRSGSGITTSVLALISTEMKIASDTLQFIADFLGPKKDAAKQKSNSYIDSAKNLTDHYTNEAKKKKDTYESEAAKKKDTYAKKAEETKDQASAKAQEKSG